MQKEISVFEGNRLSDQVPVRSNQNAMFSFSGTDRQGNHAILPVNEMIMSSHLMFLGGIGMGKSNAFYQVASQLRERMTDQDVMVVFDTKGDFYDNFYRPGRDVVISNDNRATGPEGENYWNIFRELDVDDKRDDNIAEIAKTLFNDKITNTHQPFFPNAAKDIFAAILHILPTLKGVPSADSHSLRRFFDTTPLTILRDLIANNSAFSSMASYIQNPESGQALGVISELNQLVRDVFVGNFRKKGDLSIRRLIREKQGRIIFIEYDLGIGQVLTPIYRLLVDLAIKETLCRREGERGNVFFLIDEFRLVPLLQHIDDGVNFGRSLGAKFMIGIQNIEQVFNAYGEDLARSILSGFNTVLSFRVQDYKTREFIKQLYGANRKKSLYMSTVQSRGVVEEIREANVVEDWDITNLGRGQAIIGLPSQEPFFFKFDRYVAPEILRVDADAIQ